MDGENNTTPETPAVAPIPAPTAEVSQPSAAPTVEAPMLEPEAPEVDLDASTNESPEQKSTLEPWPSLKNAMLESEVFLPFPNGKSPEPDIALAIPTTTVERTQKMLGNLPNLSYEKMPGGVEWGNYLEAAQYTICFRDGFRSTVDRKDAQFRQVVRSEKGLLAAAQPRFKENTGGQTWTGERAVLRVKALMGVGSIVQIPLWHSGFWVTLKAPSEGALLELNRRLAEEKVTLGRMTHGLAFANNSVFWAAWLMDFATAHIYESSLKPEMLEKAGYRERIKSQDLFTIVWGLACAVWPKGFPYARSVIDESGATVKVIKEMINIMKLQCTDTTQLTSWQVGHMASRVAGSMSEEAVQRYLNDFTIGKGRRVALGSGISLMLKVPSIAEYVISGQRWINGIVQMTDRAFSMPPDSTERNQYISDQGRATNMRQWSHWVEQIIVGEGDDENVISDQTTVEETLDALSQNDEYRRIYFKEIQQFIEDSTFSVIAVPATEETDVAVPRFPHLLPIDPLSAFFILLVQKTAQIQNRSE